jgi:hypothetical protein
MRNQTSIVSDYRSKFIIATITIEEDTLDIQDDDYMIRLCTDTIGVDSLREFAYTTDATLEQISIPRTSDKFTAGHIQQFKRIQLDLTRDQTVDG